MRKALVLIVVLGGAIAAYGYYGVRTVEFIPDVSTVTVTEGDVVDTVGATGALEAVTTVQVGSQVSGIIQDLYVDYNSIVRGGDVIMRLDPSLFETQLAQARANLVRAEAEVERLHVGVEDAETQLSRAENLSGRDLISETELEAAQVAVRLAKAQIRSAEAQVTQAQASLNQNEVNLEHTIIRAPIDGIVISRLVDIGQTVAASLQAPELFVIAADLTKMRVIANIDESDVGRIRPSQRVTFTVDAFPAEEFEGSVSQIRLEPVVQQNVVTYATVVDAPNPDLKLKPGMTATITLEIARRENVTRIPNSALRFRPTPDMFAALNQPVPPKLQQGPMASAGPPPADRPVADAAAGPGGAGTGGPGGGFAEQGGGFGRPGGGFGRPGGDAPDPERRRQMMERVQQMSPDEREQFIERMRAGRGGGPGGGSGGSRRLNRQSGPTVATVDRGATSIDALFAPLPVIETTGGVWVMQNGHISSVQVRLGVTDGTASELLGTIAEPTQAATPAAPNPQIAALRQQLATLEDESARGALEEQLAAIESETPATPPPSPATLAAGTQLVTNITTPDAGVGPSTGNSGSPLIPQFGFGRRGRR